MNPDDDLKQAIQTINVWKQGGKRAPHKPLLLLLALGRLQRGEDRLVRFGDIEDGLRGLLKKYGPSGKARPDYPFWFMRGDEGLWVVPGADDLPGGSPDNPPPIGVFRDAFGGFPPDTYRLLKKRPGLVRDLARAILMGHFPDTFHTDLIAEVGLNLDIGASAGKSGRDPNFRPQILNAYGYRCAMCGLDATVDGSSVGLEAAHVQWHSHEGPEVVENGLSLCALHHKALDGGVVGLTLDHRVLVSSRLHGGEPVEALIGRLHGQSLIGPVHGAQPVAERFVNWHTGNVLKKPARAA